MRPCCALLFMLVSFASFGQSGLVNNVELQGADKTRPHILIKLMKTKVGMPLDSVSIKQDLERLKRLPAISNADVQVVATEGQQYQVIFTVEENFTIIPFANLFTSSNDDFAFRVGVQDFNLLGRNMALGGFYQYDIFHSYGINFRAPYLFGNSLGIEISYKDLTTQEPVFFENATAEYRYNNQGFEVMGLYELNFKNRLELGFSPFTEKYNYIFGATSEAVPLELNVNKYLFKFIYQFNNVEYEYQYLQGFRSSLNLQYVGSSDENLPKFVLGFNDFTYFKRVGGRGNWAHRLRLGLASNMKTPFAPFTVDNNLNIRGVGNRIDRGTGAIVLNSEYRHTLVDRNWFVMQSNFFIDAGSWRNPGGSLENFVVQSNIRIYPGLGLRFIHKKIFNAIFRIDYGYGITKNASHGIVFGIGQYF
ncbi:MAG: POTRA domain-containing protein [Flavobacteriaceae bacterium]